jgi:hypothetical protein
LHGSFLARNGTVCFWSVLARFRVCIYYIFNCEILWFILWIKFDISTLCYFHSENNKSVIFTVKITKLIVTSCFWLWLYAAQLLQNLLYLKQTCSKSKEKVLNRKFNALLMNMEFISLVRRDFYNIFTRENIKNPVLLVK